MKTMSAWKAALRRACSAVALLLLLTATTGCWSRHELNELAIVVGMGIDLTDNGYRLSIQIVNPSQVSTRNGVAAGLQSVVTFTQTGKTLPEAVRRMIVQSSKRLMFTHLRIVVFGERLARAGLAAPLDYLSREPEMRNDFFLVVSRDSTPEDVLSTYSAMDPIPANNLYSKLYNSDSLWAATGQITLDKLLMDLASPGKGPTLTVIRIAGNQEIGHSRRLHQNIEPKTLLVYEGMAVFSRDKLVGWLSPDGTKSLNYLQNTINQTTGVQSCGAGGGYLSLSVTDAKSRVRVVRKGDRPAVRVSLRVEANLTDIECSLDLGDPAVLQKITRDGERLLNHMLENGVEEAQRMGVDIFGFGREVRRQRPALWHRIPDWNEEFRTLSVDIESRIHIRKIGSINLTVEQNIGK